MAWKLFGKSASVAGTLASLGPQVKEASTRLEHIERELEKAPQEGSRFLPELEQTQLVLKRIPASENLSENLTPLIQHIEHAITAIRNHDYSGALAAVKQAVVLGHQWIRDLESV